MYISVCLFLCIRKCISFSKLMRPFALGRSRLDITIEESMNPGILTSLEIIPPG